MFCPDCPNYSKCFKLCNAVEKYLRKLKIYSSRYIRKTKESPFDHDKLDYLSAKKAFKLKGLSY